MKQNILLLHGALGTKDQLKSFKEKLADEFYVYSMNFEGHGNIESSRDFTMKLFTENVIEYLKEHKIKRTHIFGYSMGGYVALNVAKSYPEFVERIITLGTKFDWTEESAEKEVKMLDPETIVKKVPKFAQMLVSIHGNNNWKQVVIKTASMMNELAKGAKLSKKDLAGIEQKVLIGVGDQDKMVTMDESLESAEVLPNGKLKIIRNCQHSIDKINQDELKAIIVDFIKN